nr:immunoglobulin light chain junction region [Macaca mulatta]MPO10576.1 immunoglobulin light chain junction region [Macaca mulatta]MPO11673.1 immunoglobulin light chain junction region [Macaca mulatta]MPO13416.1 immunoglobulin light chain junction region [Macaca mulatta]
CAAWDDSPSGYIF